MAAGLVWAQTEETPTLHIPRVTRAPKLTDFLNNEPREAELKVTDFRQMDPGDGDPVSQPTTAFLSYDDKNLYVAFIAKDDPKKIRARVAKRKQILFDDRVTINIDTFHDHRHAYWFDVNPYAVQLDGITTDGYGDDFSWEGLWYTEAKITDDGYVVLITVPFKTIRFPDSEEQRWGVVLGRFIQRNNEFAMWPYVTRKRLPQFVAQFGHMDGLKNISPGRNLQFIPYAMGAASRYLDRPDGAVPAYVNKNDFRAGLDSKVVIKDALTLDLTLNPDFSQVESDEPQVTVNQRFEVFYPERRPFFMENNSYFTTPQQLFFSRRIIDPEFGVRLTGRLGRWNIGTLFADDRAPGKLVPKDSEHYGKRATNGVISVQRDFWKDSHLRLFATDREFARSYNRMGSLDTRIRLKNNFYLAAQAATSDSRTLKGDPFAGNAYYVRLQRNSRKMQLYSQYTDRSPGFRADLGFIPRVDIREFKNRIAYKWWPEKSTVVNFGPALTVMGNWNRLGQTQDWSITPEFDIELKRLTKFTVSRDEMYELYQGQGFRKGAWNVIGESEWFKWLAATALFTQGSSVNFYPASGIDPFLADSVSGSLSLTVRPTPRLRLDEAYLYSQLKTQGYLPLAPAGTAVFNNHIVRSKVNYQFTRELSFRAIVDYNGVLPNESLVSLQRTKRMSYDFLFTYLLHPGTALYVGYTDIYANLQFDPSRPPYAQLAGYPDQNVGRQFFVKLSYLFRF